MHVGSFFSLKFSSVSSRNYPGWIARSLALPFRFNHYLFASLILGELHSRLSALPLSRDLNTLS
ncbi:unnamed protein product [Brassica oleracea var. botrytis]